MIVLQVCAFAAEYPGNFMATLIALEDVLKEKKIESVYAFPQRASSMPWCRDLCQRSKVYFLPENNARILPETYKIFRKIYSENDISIIHSHFELYDIPATLLAPKNIKIYWHLHDPIGDGYIKSGFARKVLTRFQYGWVGKKATLLTVSEKHGEFAAKLGFPRNKIEYFPNGINTERIKQVDSNDYISNVKKMLLLGWDVYRKGVDVLVAAAEYVKCSNYLIRVVGLEKCEEYLKDNKQDSLMFVRPVTDINTLFQDTSVFLHISRAEGQSYALLEAIYAGLIVICSDIPENQFAKEFKNVHWVKTGDVCDLAETIKYVLDEIDVPKQEDISFNREIIEQKYSIKSWVKQMTFKYLVDEK